MRNVKPGHVQPVVCLDAGHYGKYNRSPAVKTYYESEMNWKLHNYLATELEGYGIQVTKTRTEQGKDLFLYNRGAASKGCDLFLSIHSNAVGDNVDESVDYVRIYHLVDDKGTTVDDQSKAVAKLLLPVIVDLMQPKQGGHITTRKSTKDSNGDGVLNDNYYGVLNGARQVGTAGLILEHSFHTNTRSTLWLLEDENLRKLAKAEAKVIAEYYGMVKTEDKPAETKPVEKPAEKPSLEPEHWYRIRKTWEDAGSQIAAYKAYDGAIKDCPVGYSVFDWNGKVVYSNNPTQAVTTYTLTLPVLRKGDSGKRVEAMQNLLLAKNIELPICGADGYFGEETEAGVIEFQKTRGIAANGVVEHDTMSKLLGV